MKCNLLERYAAKKKQEEEDEYKLDLQKSWMKVACSILHEQFGFGEDRCLRFIAAWKRKSHTFNTQGSYEKQHELANQMISFFKNYPEDWIDKLGKD